MEHQSQSVAAAYARYQRTVTGHMRVVLAEKNMEIMHDLGRHLQVLDAGGGNGLNTEWLLQRGHDVTLLDEDPEMLEQARQRLEARKPRGRYQLVRGDIERSAAIFSDRRFDLIVCHHVFEYLRDPPQVMKDLHGLAAPGGEFSLVTLNPVSEVIRAIVFRKDGALARSRLTDRAYDAKWFGEGTLYHLDQVLQWGARSGWKLRDFRAIRVLADYIPEHEYSEATIREVTALEAATAGQEPYRRMGRYLQFSFTSDINQAPVDA